MAVLCQYVLIESVGQSSCCFLAVAHIQAIRDKPHKSRVDKLHSICVFFRRSAGILFSILRVCESAGGPEANRTNGADVADCGVRAGLNCGYWRSSATDRVALIRERRAEVQDATIAVRKESAGARASVRAPQRMGKRARVGSVFLSSGTMSVSLLA